MLFSPSASLDLSKISHSHPSKELFLMPNETVSVNPSSSVHVMNPSEPSTLFTCSSGYFQMDTHLQQLTKQDRLLSQTHTRERQEFFLYMYTCTSPKFNISRNSVE
ncbi:hypothetical protein SAY86_001156 [Trapa natans]|uniref:Uncharacterized protein n=1 Tax=Trapa natans TaxID=22666 RepID=A0AAN7RNM2_TRANT|nr:hypothetical protein SAY86_001156 [Trapa natans]